MKICQTPKQNQHFEIAIAVETLYDDDMIKVNLLIYQEEDAWNGVDLAGGETGGTEDEVYDHSGHDCGHKRGSHQKSVSVTQRCVW